MPQKRVQRMQLTVNKVAVIKFREFGGQLYESIPSQA